MSSRALAPRRECQGQRRYHDVLVGWRCERLAESCRVTVYWRDELIVDAPLNAAHRRLPFSVTSEDEPHLAVEGEFVFEPATHVLLLRYLRTPAGAWRDERLCPGHPEPPVPPLPPVPPPEPPVPQDGEIVAGGGDLFPYVYLHDWPAVSPQALENRFVRYAANCAAGDTRLYCALLAIDRDAPGARGAMVAQALAFIAGDGDYAGQFAPRAHALDGPIGRFAGFSAAMAARPAVDLAQFVRALERHLRLGWLEVVFYLGSTEFSQQLDRAWQNVFALTIVAGYDRAGAAQMIRTVTMAQLLLRIAEGGSDIAAMTAGADGGEGGTGYLAPPDGNGSDAGVGYEADAAARGGNASAGEAGIGVQAARDFPPPPWPWPPRRLREGVYATVVLPAPVFPLPPAQVAPAPLSTVPVSRVTPYAIGDLRLVRRRLVRYEPGEVSHVENVMAGERKRSRTRERQRERSVTLDAQQREDTAQAQTQGQASSFEQHARAVVRERWKLGFETTYGPPTEATQKGHYQLDPVDGAPTDERQRDRDGFAREVTTLAARRLAQEVHDARRHESLREHDSAVQHDFDRRDGDGPARGIYRWLNAVYRCWVSPRGRRFVLELMLPRPAAGYIAAQFDLAGVALAEPPSPQSLGVFAFTDISLDAESPRYYARLAALYDVADAAPPPDPALTLAATFESASPLTMQVLAVPAGYESTHATAVLNSADTTLVADGTLGSRRFQAKASDIDEPKPVALALETASLPLAVTVHGGTVPPPTAGTRERKSAMAMTATLPFPTAAAEDETPATPWVLAIAVTCKPTAHAIDQWKSALYTRLVAGWQARRRAWLDAAGVPRQRGEAANTLAWRDVVRDELRRGGLRAIARVVAQHTGEAGRELRFLPALLSWLDHALEWSAMTWSFLLDLDGDGQHHVRRVAGADDTLTAFLDAAHARLLLPVAPGHELAIAYLLATGMVWSGQDALAPTVESAIAAEAGSAATTWVDLVDDLKQGGEAPGDDPPRPPEPPLPDAWFVLVPTTLSWLQEGSELPHFD